MISIKSQFHIAFPRTVIAIFIEGAAVPASFAVVKFSENRAKYVKIVRKMDEKWMRNGRKMDEKWMKN